MHALVLLLAPAVALAASAEAPAPPPAEVAALVETTPPPGEAAAAVEAAPQRGRVRVVYTGDLGGVGAGNYLLESVRDLRAVDARLEGDLTALRVVNGVAAWGEVALHAEDGRVETLLGALDGAGPRCAEEVPLVALRGPADTVMLPADAPADLVAALEARGLRREAWASRRCETSSGGTVALVGPPGAAAPSWSADGWELRRGVHGELRVGERSYPVRVTALPIQEYSRLVTQALALRAEDPGALYVDAGSFLDGVSSVANDRLSLHRGLGWQTLQRLAPAALVPGEHELARGAAVLHQELASRPLPYVATNWEAPAALELPTHHLVEVATEVGTVRVAFLGLVDPALAGTVPQLGAEGVRITDPVAGVQPVIDALYAGPTPPDAVVLLTTADGATLARLRRELRGVDLLAGDPSLATLRVQERTTRLRPLAPHEKGAALTLPLDGLATVDLVFDGAHRLVEVVATPRLVQTDLPRDEQITRAIARVRAESYPALDRPLVPAVDPEDPAASWDEARWSALVCEVLRDATGSEVVALRELPAPTRLPGPLTELLVVDHLAMLDLLEVHRVPGSALQAVVDQAHVAVPVVCGATPGEDVEPGGRDLDPDRVYRLLTTDRTRLATPLGAILDDVAADGPLDPAPRTVPRGQKGQPWTLRAATLQGLRAIRAEQPDPDAAVRHFLEEAPGRTPPLWLLHLRGLRFAVDRFQGTDQPALSAVPETLATSPSSLTLALQADVALEYDDPAVAWDLRYRQGYATLRTAGAEGQETEDDLRASTSLEVPALALPRGAALPWAPYAELLFDSELSPTFDEAGLENPQQADLSLTAGLSADSGEILDRLRVGAFVNRDLAQLADKPTEWGGKVELETSVDVGFAAWGTEAEGLLWADTPDDDASDLRFQVLGRTALALPLARWLSLSGYAQGFLLQGRVPENDVLGLSWTLGAALEGKGAFRL